jgi:hypothetical protein
MKKVRLATVFVFLISNLICSAQTAGTAKPGISSSENNASGQFDAQLIESVKQLSVASQRNDGDYFKRTLTDDFIAVPKNGGTVERADFLEDILGADKSQENKEIRLYNIRVLPLSEAAALVTYDEIAPGEGPRYRHVTDIWTKQADQWKLKFQQTTPNLWSFGD